MGHRIKNLWIYILFVGFFILSLGYNWHLINQITNLEKTIQNHHWVTGYELIRVKQEINRLENIKY